MKSVTKKVIMVLVFAGVFGFGTYAFGGWGMGYGHHGRYHHGSDWDHHGPEWHHRGGFGYDSGPDDNGNLSEDQIEKLEQYRSEYLKATENIREKLYEKELTLRNELAKEDTDTNKASKLQNEISKLQSELDQKRLEHEIKARKNVPNYNRGYRDHGPMMGYAPRGGGYCWR